MAKKSAPKEAPAVESDSLASAVDRLAAEVGCLRQVIDEIREDFSWLTRNGLPVRPIEHTHVKRMALDPCADDWGERLDIERSTYHPRGSLSPLDSVTLDEIADDLKSAFECAAQGQLEVILTALDGVRGEILAALKRRRGDPAAESVAVESAPPLTSSSPPLDDSAPKPPPGRLF